MSHLGTQKYKFTLKKVLFLFPFLKTSSNRQLISYNPTKLPSDLGAAKEEGAPSSFPAKTTNLNA